MPLLPPEDFRKEKCSRALVSVFLLKSVFQGSDDLFHPLGLRLFGRAVVFMS